MLEGELGDFTLPDILRLLALTNKTGDLRLRGANQAGRVELLEGRVRHASAAAGRVGLARRLLGTGLLAGDRLIEVLGGEESLLGDLELGRRLIESGEVEAAAVAEQVREQTVDAVFDLLRWDSGSFAFEVRGPEGRRPSLLDLAIPVEELLEEVGRRFEAWPTLSQRTGADQDVVTITPPGREHVEVALPPDAWMLLGLIDGQRTVGDLVRLTGQGAYRTRRTLAALLDERIVTVGATGGVSPVERLVRDHTRLDDLERRFADGAASNVLPDAPAATAPAPASRAATAPAAAAAAPAASTRRLRPDPTVNPELVDQLIEGVSNL